MAARTLGRAASLTGASGPRNHVLEQNRAAAMAAFTGPGFASTNMAFVHRQERQIGPPRALAIPIEGEVRRLGHRAGDGHWTSR